MKKLNLGDRIFGMGYIAQDKIAKNRAQKVYGRVMGNRK
jgi:hypothetical protein